MASLYHNLLSLESKPLPNQRPSGLANRYESVSVVMVPIGSSNSAIKCMLANGYSSLFRMYQNKSTTSDSFVFLKAKEIGSL